MISEKKQKKVCKKICICAITAIVFMVYWFVGIGKSQAQEKAKEELPNDININTNELASGSKISLGSCILNSDNTFTVNLSWIGEGPVVIQCKNQKTNEVENEYILKNGFDCVFRIQADGEYSFPIINKGTAKVKNVKGTVKFDTVKSISGKSIGIMLTQKKKISKSLITDDSPNPMVFEFNEIKPNESMEHYSYKLEPGDKYTISMKWSGNQALNVQCKLLGKKDIIVADHKITNGVSVTFEVSKTGEYSFPIINKGKNAVKDISGSIVFK